MKNPIQVFIGPIDLLIPRIITQKIYVINEKEKADKVSNILK
jgi:hypothetical protein